MTVEYSVADGAATIALDRPEARNALNLEMCIALLEATARAEKDPSVKLVFVRGNGPSFCGGADLKERQGKSEQWIRERRLKAFAAYEALEALPMPCVALVQGAAIGSGAEIAEAILKAPPLALRLGKRAIDRGIELDPKGARQAEIEAIEEQLASGQWMGKA